MKTKIAAGGVNLFSSIRTKMLISFGLLFIVTLVAFEVVRTYGAPFTSFKGEYLEEQSRVFKSLNLVADLKKELLMRWIEERIDNAKVIAESDLLKPYLAELNKVIQKNTVSGLDDRALWAEVRKNEAFQIVKKHLILVKSTYDVYADIEIVDPDSGSVIVSDRSRLLGKRVIDRIILSNIFQNNGRLISAGINPVDGELDLNIYFAVKDKAKDIAILIMHVNTRDFMEPMLHTGEGLGVTGEALLVDQDVNILASLKYALPDGTIPKPLNYRIKAKPALFAASGEEGSIAAEDYRGIPVLAAYRHLRITSELGWGLVVKEDQAEIFAPFKARIVHSLLITIFGAIFVIAVIFVIVRNISGPILALSNTAGKIERGDLCARAPVTTSDEVGSLSVIFNSMAQRVQDWHNELDSQVKTRTEQLNSANKDLEMEIIERMKVQEELKKSRDNMENLINKRTEELKASNRELQIAVKEMETFSYSISHDLKAPLRAVNGFSNILLEDYAGSLDAEGLRILNVIHTNVVQIRQLIDDILRLSRMGLQPLKKSEIDMKKLAEDIFAELKQECPERTINFHVNPLPSCQGDSVLITQIMRNLLSNAIKFTGQREVAEIEAGSRLNNEKPVYYVKDNGVGFDMKYAEKLFSLFQRLHSPKDFEGTGVGLAIVQRLVHRHGGRIWAEAKVNEGATFFFTF